MNVYIGQNTKNERSYRSKHKTNTKMNVYIGQNTKNERLYWPKHKK